MLYKNSYTINNLMYNLLKNIILGKDIYIVESDDKTYKEIKALIDKINSYYFYDINDKKIQVLFRKILNNIDKITEVLNSFNREYNGKTLNNLYKITNEEFIKTTWKIQSYNIIKDFLLQNNVSEIELLEFSKVLNNNDIIDSYYKYRRFCSNKKISNIKDDIDINDINLIINKLSGVLNNKYAFQPPIFMNKYTKDFSNAKIDIKNCSEYDILKLANEVNLKYNSNLINSESKFKAGSIMYYLNRLIHYKKYKSNKKKYDSYGDIIYEQYKENIDNLRIFFNSFKFIDIAVCNNVMNDLEKKLLDEDDLFIYISNIRDSLIIYKEFLSIKEKIDKIDSKVVNLLKNLYDTIDNKKELNNLIKFIPLFFQYNNIEAIEKKENKNILLYQNISKYFDEIIIALNNLNTIKETCIDKYNIPIKLIKDNEKGLLNENNKDITLIEGKDIIKVQNKIPKKDKECEEIDYILNSINKILLSLGYNTKILDSTLLKVIKDEQKYLYISFSNTTNVFNKISTIISLLLEEEEIVFVWDRDWWLDKASEINKIKLKLDSM